MSYREDTTADEAIRNIQRSRSSNKFDYSKFELIAQKSPTPPKSFPVKIALMKAKGQQYEQITEYHKVGNVDFVSLDNAGITEVHSIIANPSVGDDFKVIKIKENTLYFNTKVRNDTKLRVVYTYKVY